MVRKTIKEPEVFAEYFRRVFMEQAADGLQRLEVRVSSSEVTEEKLRMLLDAYDSVKKEYPGFTLKFIVNETKRHSNNTVEKIPGLIDTIEYSGGTDKERKELKALWQKSWDEFIKRRSEPSGLDPRTSRDLLSLYILSAKIPRMI